AHRQARAETSCRPFASSSDHNDLAAGALFDLQGFFDRKFIVRIHHKCNLRPIHGFAVRSNLDLDRRIRDVLDTNHDSHDKAVSRMPLYSSKRFKRMLAFVPPKPKLLESA